MMKIFNRFSFYIWHKYFLSFDDIVIAASLKVAYI